MFTSFSVEAVQTETTLQLGETKNGFVSKDNFETYVVTPKNALVSVRNMDQQGSHREPCAKLSGALLNGSTVKWENIVGGNLQMAVKDQVEFIYVKGIGSGCSYQISYISLDMPLNNAKLSQPYELQLEAGQSKKFIYYHANPTAFKIVKLEGAGKLTVHILNMSDPKMTLKEALLINPESYPLMEGEEGEHRVSQDDPHFCFDCFYLVVVSTATSFEGEVIFLRINDPIPLTPKYILKQRLQPDLELAVENYIYYSQTDFELTFQIISGSI